MTKVNYLPIKGLSVIEVVSLKLLHFSFNLHLPYHQTYTLITEPSTAIYSIAASPKYSYSTIAIIVNEALSLKFHSNYYSTTVAIMVT